VNPPPPPWYALPAALLTAVTAIAAGLVYGHTHAAGWPWWARVLAAVATYAGTALAAAIPAVAAWVFAVLVADMSDGDP